MRKQKQGKNRPLTPKNLQLLKHYANPASPIVGNGRQSAIAAGYSEKSAHVTAHRVLKKDNAERELNRIFDRAGVTTDKLASRVRRALDAKYDQPFIHQRTGNVVYAKRRPDWEIQLKAVRLAGEFRGDFAPKQVDVRVAVLAGKLQAARQRMAKQQAQDVVVEADNNQPDEPSD